MYLSHTSMETKPIFKTWVDMIDFKSWKCFGLLLQIYIIWNIDVDK